MPTVVRKRANRVSREPVRDRSGDVKVVIPKNLTDEDIQSFLIVYEHYATIPQIAALTGRNDNWVRQRSCQLKRQSHPYKYIDLCSQHRATPKAYQNDYQRFELPKDGRDTLINKGIVLPPKFPRSSSFPHDTFADDGILSLKFGLRNHPEIRCIGPLDILSSKNIPAKVRDSESWHYFPVDADHTRKKNINPDYFPLGFARPFDAHGEWPFVVFEFETGANGVSLADYPKSSICYKLLSWLDVLKRETYWHHLGLPSLYIAFICGGIAKEQTVLNMIDLYIPAEYRNFFLVKTHRPLGPAHDPQVSDYILTEDYKRVTTPFNILSSKLD